MAGKSKLIKQQQKQKLPSVNKEEPNFFNNVWEVAKLIPKGRVTSYGAIANYLGTKSSARMVGWAMNGCHHAKLKIPAHRVVNRNGILTGKFHFSPPEKMEQLLKKEGIKVKDNQIVDFKQHFWDPNEALGFEPIP